MINRARKASSASPFACSRTAEPSSIGRPTSAWVPALVTSKAPGRAQLRPSRSSTAAYGDRQMFPVHTVSRRTFSVASGLGSAASMSPSA